MDKYLLEGIDSYIFHDRKIKKEDLDILVGKFDERKVLEILELLKDKKIKIEYDELMELEDDDLYDYTNEELCRSYQRGNKIALDILIQKNERLVYSRVMRYYKMYKHSLSIDDLYQEGCIGMLKAVNKFDYDLGFKFSTYSINWIDQSIARSIADKGYTIRVPVHMFDNVNKFNRISKELELDNITQDEKLEQLAKDTGFKKSQLKEINNISRNILNISSLNVKVGEVEDTELISFLESDETENPIDVIMDVNLGEKIDEALDTLSDREKDIIKLRFGLEDNMPKTLEEIGDMFSLTRERIRQIEKKALVKLKYSSKSIGLKEFLYNE